MKRTTTLALLAGILFFCAALGAAQSATLGAQQTSQAQKTRPKVAVVLEGGSAWGFAHIGVLKVIEELGIPVDIVVGTSMGSIVGGLYAAGYNATEIENIAESTDWSSLFIEDRGKTRLAWQDSLDQEEYMGALQFDRKGVYFTGGLISGNRIVRFFDTLLVNSPSPANFDKLPRRYRAVATDVVNGEQVVYSSGSISDAMRASMSIPGVFTPYHYDGHYLVDGGLVNNLPVDVAREMGADIVIAIDLFSEREINDDTLNRSPLLSLSQSIDIALRANVKRQLPGADLVIPVNIAGFIVTDFDKTIPIAERGEKIARENIDKLKAIRDRLGDAQTTPVVRPEEPPVSRVLVEGGTTPKETARIRAMFEPIVGTNPSPKSFGKIFAAIDQSGTYDSVRIRRDSKQEDKPLVVTLHPTPPPKHELKFCYQYSATVGKSVTSKLDMKPVVIVRRLTTPDSQLRVEGELLDTPDFRISFIQPVGNILAVTPYYAYERESLSQFEDSSFTVQYQTGKNVTGLNFDLTPVAGINLNFGWHYDWRLRQDLPNVDSTTDISHASIVEAGFRIRRNDSPVFPTQGVSMSCKALYSLPSIGSDRFFQVYQTEGSASLSLGTPFSVAFLWKGGTDFSVRGDNSTSAPPIYKPSLVSRRMFPGPLSIDEEIGSHALGAGLEIKQNLSWGSRGITLPVFLIAQTTVGTVMQDPSETDWATDRLHGNTAFGLGIRVSDSFGIEVRAGFHTNLKTENNISRKTQPFVAFDIGSIGL